MSEGNVRGRIKSERTWLVHDDQTDSTTLGRTFGKIMSHADEDTTEDNAVLIAVLWNAVHEIAGPDGNPLKVAGALEEIVRAARMLHTAGDHEMGGANSANARSLATVALRKAGLL